MGSGPKRLMVAVVEDDVSLARSLARLLFAAGMESVVFASAEMFIATRGDRVFDCLLMDVRLPGMTGVELCNVLHRSGSASPVVFLTSLSFAEIKAGLVDKDRVGYVHKIEPSAVLIAAIQRAAQLRDSGEDAAEGVSGKGDAPSLS